MALHQRYNNENILIRAIVAGILNILNNKIVYEQVWSNDDIETIKVPWFYNMSGDERFMQDFYTHYAHCLPPKPVDGNFDYIPRGVITYAGSTIDSGRITSRYVQGTYLKDVNGQLQTMRSFLYQIPLNVNFNAEMWFDTQITSLKVEQIIRETFYKTITFYVYYRGMRVGCSVGFPEDIGLEKNINYSFESDNKIKLTFSLQVESYQPVFDPTTEVNANEYMTGIGYRLVDKNMQKNDGNIKITHETKESFENSILPKGWSYMFEWDYTDENANINKVDIFWTPTNDITKKHIIERGVPNHEYYVWNIPNNFTEYKNPLIIWDENEDVKVYREPKVSILPDILDNNNIKNTSFNIIDPGYFITLNDTSINVILELRDDNNKISYTNDTDIYANIKYNKLDSFVVIGNIVQPGDVFSKSIDIYIVNSVTTYDHERTDSGLSESFGVIKNITIV